MQFRRPGNPQAYGFVLTDIIKNGSFCVWDPTAIATSNGETVASGAMRPLTAGIGSAGAFFLGITSGQFPLSSPIDNANPMQQPGDILVMREGIFLANTTTAETYVHGTKVYAANTGSDDLTITTVSGGGTLVGYVNLPGGSSVTGAVGQQVGIELNADITKGSNAILSA